MSNSGISIVAPAYQEEENLPELVRSVGKAFLTFDSWELIVVDDGSTDNSAAVLAGLQSEHSRLRVVRHVSRRGQSAAMCAGADAARYAWLGFLDADGQNDPADLAKLYSEVLEAEGTARGMIMGHRQERKDGWLTRLSSRIANSVRAGLLRDRTPDTGCSLKVLARDDFLALPRFDHMHRFLPALLLRQGLHTISRPVAHYSRRAGRSKYGLGNRLWVGIADLLGVWWLSRRRFPPGASEEKQQDERTH